MKMYVLSIALIFHLFSKGLTLHCYQCSSTADNFNQGCVGEELDSSYISSCLEGKKCCIVEIKNMTSGNINLSRQCCIPPRPNSCSTHRGTELCLKSCGTDECNSGRVKRPAVQECYQCTSKDKANQGCEPGTLNPAYRQPCPEGHNFCRVAKTRVDQNPHFPERSGTTTLVRDCYKEPPRQHIACAYLGILTSCFTVCREGNCNSGDVFLPEKDDR